MKTHFKDLREGKEQDRIKRAAEKNKLNSAAKRRTEFAQDGLAFKAPDGPVPGLRPNLIEDSLEEAQGLEREQQAMLEAAPVEQAYQENLELHVRAKHDQVQRVEDRLEGLIDRQQARLQQMQAKSPGFLSRPSAKRTWNAQKAQQLARLQTLHYRLDSVREIKEGMGIHSPRIEELATRKMRAENPDLASDWDAMREAARKHQVAAWQKEKERDQRLSQERGRSQSLGLGSRPA